MDWLNLHTSIIDSPEATVCDPVRRSTWVWLLRFCIGQENSGTIKDCRKWGDTTWQQMAKVRLREVNLESSLYYWDGDNLVVRFYPVEKEAEVQRNRQHGKLGGRPPKNNHPVNHPVIPNETTRFVSAETEGNRKGIGKEGKGTEAVAADAADDFSLASEKQTKALAGLLRSKYSLLKYVKVNTLSVWIADYGRENIEWAIADMAKFGDDHDNDSMRIRLTGRKSPSGGWDGYAPRQDNPLSRESATEWIGDMTNCLESTEKRPAEDPSGEAEPRKAVGE